MEPEATLRQWVAQGSRMVFFGGAGVSTESGIPDFRSADGLYRRHARISPETILSHRFFLEHPADFYAFYREKMLCTDARPNAAHRALARLEQQGKLAGVVTQNIDGLHQKAGSRTVWELHGSIYRNHCMKCGRPFTVEAVARGADAPRCSCGGLIKPDVVLYGEPLDQTVLDGAIEALARADVLIVGGTSLAVYPAAGLVDFYTGHRLILINHDETPLDERADLVIHASLGTVLQRAVESYG